MSEINLLNLDPEVPTSEQSNQAEPTRLENAKAQTTWLAVVVGVDGGETIIWKDELVPRLRQGLLDGSFASGSTMQIHSQAEDGAWSQTDGTVADLVQQHFGLRVLYAPVWEHAKAGLKWGALVGVGLKLLDTTIALASVDPATAFLFLVAIGVCMVPRLGSMAAAAVWFALFKFSKINLFVVMLGAAAAGAALGCLPGMAVGGLIGLAKRRSLPLAPDARPEPDHVALTAFALPLTSAVTLIALYVGVVNPWMASVVSR